MSGGLLELVARGVQDIPLIGKPQITFFKVVYKNILILVWKVFVLLWMVMPISVRK